MRALTTALAALLSLLPATAIQADQRGSLMTGKCGEDCHAQDHAALANSQGTHLTGCPKGADLVTGGYELLNYEPAPAGCIRIIGSYPFDNKWRVGYVNKGSNCLPVTIRIFVICEK